MKSSKPLAKAGRPRTFCAEQALDHAMKVFWEKGYEGSSLPDLTAAMGMNRPSLYAVFGNKQELFHKALERYGATRMGFFDRALALPTARAVVERVLIDYIAVQTEAGSPRGCLRINCALACGDDAQPVRDELAAARAGCELKLRQRLQRAVAEGDLAPDADPELLARYVMSLAQGMAVQASGGVTRAQLLPLVALAMRAWPG